MLLLYMILLGCSPATPDSGQALGSKIHPVAIQAETPKVVTTGAEQVPSAAVSPSAESDPDPIAPVIPDPETTPASTHIPNEPIEGFQICSPLAGIPVDELADIISAPYAPPAPGKEDRHHGLDFSFYRRGDNASILGLGVQTAVDSKVVMVLADSFPYGNALMLETAGTAIPEAVRDRLDMDQEESLYVLYAHLSDPPTAALLESLPSCDLVGFVGKSGNAGVPHLHMETRIGPSGEVFAGMNYYSTQTTPDERANYIRWRTSGDFIHFDPFLIFEIHASSLFSADADDGS